MKHINIEGDVEVDLETSTAQRRTIDLTPLFIDLPSNVSTQEQLESLPKNMKSGNPVKPLQYIDDVTGEILHYSLQPMMYSVIFILAIELLERFSYYGITYTETSFLTGVYNDDWNAGMTAVNASSYVSISTAIAYTTPFLGAILADSFLGEYRVILYFVLLFYIPGIFLLAMTTIPDLFSDTFNKTALAIGLLILWPIGTGTVKSVVVSIMQYEVKTHDTACDQNSLKTLMIVLLIIFDFKECFWRQTISSNTSINFD
jgi:dipeptide/tripeptide permease